MTHCLKFIKKISIVVVFEKSNIINNLENINYIVNKKYDKTEMMYSLYLAFKNNKGRCDYFYFIFSKIFQKYIKINQKQIILPIYEMERSLEKRKKYL